MKLISTIVGLLVIIGLSLEGRAQSGITFTSSMLAGENLITPTTMPFAPDNRLHVTQQDGTIFAFAIQKNGPNNYSVLTTETITLVKNIPIHNHRGALIPRLTTRQITG